MRALIRRIKSKQALGIVEENETGFINYSPKIHSSNLNYFPILSLAGARPDSVFNILAICIFLTGLMVLNIRQDIHLFVVKSKYAYMIEYFGK